jgi:FkbM family methyltransferase
MQEYIYFDIGANVGAWSLANIERCDRIIAVEASPSTCKVLLANCAAAAGKIECLNYAVCNSDQDEITFYESEQNVLNTLNKEWLTSETSRFANTAFQETKCKTISIDKLIQLYGQPTFIKIDVEGAENLVLKSLTSKAASMICFEWASEFNHITNECLDHLEQLGYTKFAIQYTDSYTYRPNTSASIDVIREELSKTIAKQDWGMIWCM